MDPDRALVPGQELRFPRPMVSLLPEGHPHRTTVLGPLIPRDAAVRYIGPYPGRPGMHLAATNNDLVSCEVPFQLAARSWALFRKDALQRHLDTGELGH